LNPLATFKDQMSNSIIDYQLINDWRRAVEFGDEET